MVASLSTTIHSYDHQTISKSFSDDFGRAMEGCKRYMKDSSQHHDGDHRVPLPLKRPVASSVRHTREQDRESFRQRSHFPASAKPKDDDTSSVGSRSAFSRDSSQRNHDHVIRNMKEMTRSVSRNRSGQSSRDRRTTASVTSGSTRRSRGPSLERAVSAAILETAAWGDAYFVTKHDSSRTDTSASVECILQDLDQAFSVMHNSSLLYSQASRFSQTGAQPYKSCTPSIMQSLLPPLSRKPSEDVIDHVFQRKQNHKDHLPTPDTSDESSFDALERPKNSMDTVRRPTTVASSPIPHVPGNVQPAKQRSTTVNRGRPKIGEDDDQNWATFDLNPFVSTWPSEDDLDECSRDAKTPTSVADPDFPFRVLTKSPKFHRKKVRPPMAL